jgi:inhibitor of cysteine peptidase
MDILTGGKTRGWAAEVADFVRLFGQRCCSIISLLLYLLLLANLLGSEDGSLRVPNSPLSRVQEAQHEQRAAGAEPCWYDLMPYKLSHSKWYKILAWSIISAATTKLDYRAVNAIERVGRGKTMRQFSESDNGREIEVPIGEIIEVCLRDNPTTGFKWSFKSSGEPACTLVTEFFSREGTSPGQGGTHHWQFKIVAPGRATIELVYTRPWQTGAPPARSYILKLRADG